MGAWRQRQRGGGGLRPGGGLGGGLGRVGGRGEVRGGRVVTSIAGEQFALPEAVTLLRETRRAPLSGKFVSISGADPLNVVGTLLPGTKVAAITGNRVLYRDGVAVAAFIAGEVRWLGSLEPAEARTAENALIRRAAGSPLLAYLH